MSMTATLEARLRGRFTGNDPLWWDGGVQYGA